MTTLTVEPEVCTQETGCEESILLSPIATLKEHGGHAVNCGCESFECGCSGDCHCDGDDIRPS